MSTTCNRCGAAILDGQRFCNSCGAPQNQAASPTPRFCVSCGSQMAAGGAFCVKCGAPADPGTKRPQTPSPEAPVEPANVVASATIDAPVAVEAADSETPAMPPVIVPTRFAPVPSVAPPSNVALNASLPPNQTTGTNGKGCITALIVTLVAIGVVVLAVIGGMIYVAHRVKNKVEEFAKEEMHHAQGSLSQTSAKTNIDMSDVPGSFQPNGRLAESCPDVTAVAPDDSESAAKVPLREGLTWVSAWRRFNGDVEMIHKVAAVAPSHVDVLSSGLAFADSRAVDGHELSTMRVICRSDLQSASTYMTENRAEYPAIIPQTTTFSMSQNSFQQLKNTGKFTITYQQFARASGRQVPVPQTAEMTRVEPTDVNYPVILNGQPTNVPVIHARGHFRFSGVDKVEKIYRDPSFLSEDGEIFVVDDPANPVTMLWAMGPVFQIRVVSITFPEDKPKPQIEDQLAKQKKAVIYGIYFDFNQASIKKESEPVLKEIADAMKNNLDWVLTVNGYTDNIGGDAYNLDLSKRRAASVKKALGDRFGVAPTRLTTDGFGASSPVDTNETLEGRARNRRVELIRQ
jgi:outer membrane protein OmpA-like peptidoglycan-associated protein